jgi:glyoxylase-like metal-dependent hydrolase (beta-lactamase superfamily II)
MKLGNINISVFDGGRFKLDGGAMFGIIPRPLWSKRAPADELHRIRLGTNCLLLDVAGKRVLVETGLGNKYADKERAIFDIANHWIVDSLADAGLSPDAIDIVILTHLHFDHAGGATRLEPDGRAVTTFPRARYIVQRGEWEDYRNNYSVMSATYRAENLEPLADSGRLELIDGDAEILPGVAVRKLPGHTRHQQGVVIAGGGLTAVQPADLMPTSAHVGLPYNMAYDLLPYDNMQNKKKLLAEATQKNWLILSGHDPDHVAYKVSEDPRGGFALTRADL